MNREIGVVIAAVICLLLGLGVWRAFQAPPPAPPVPPTADAFVKSCKEACGARGVREARYTPSLGSWSCDCGSCTCLTYP